MLLHARRCRSGVPPLGRWQCLVLKLLRELDTMKKDLESIPKDSHSRRRLRSAVKFRRHQGERNSCWLWLRRRHDVFLSAKGWCTRQGYRNRHDRWDAWKSKKECKSSRLKCYCIIPQRTAQSSQELSVSRWCHRTAKVIQGNGHSNPVHRLAMRKKSIYL
jgi:hypothetical protein